MLWEEVGPWTIWFQQTSKQPDLEICGKGQWKVWTPEAILRAAFAKEVLPARAVAAQVDGSSGSYARETRSFIAASLDKEQKEGWARQVAQAQHDAGGRLSYVLCNMMFDETELEVSVQDFRSRAVEYIGFTYPVDDCGFW